MMGMLKETIYNNILFLGEKWMSNVVEMVFKKIGASV